MQILVHIEWGDLDPSVHLYCGATEPPTDHFTLTVEVSRRKWNGFKGLEFKCVCDFTVL